MMSNNNRGSYRTTKAHMMRAFGKLPPDGWRALADAAVNYCSATAPDALAARCLEALIKLIEISDRQELARERERKGTAP